MELTHCHNITSKYMKADCQVARPVASGWVNKETVAGLRDFSPISTSPSLKIIPNQQQSEENQGACHANAV